MVLRAAIFRLAIGPRAVGMDSLRTGLEQSVLIPATPSRRALASSLHLPPPPKALGSLHWP